VVELGADGGVRLMVTIRQYVPADRLGVLSMGRAFYAATHYAAMAPYDPITVAGLVDFLASDGLILVAEHEGSLVGMVGLIVSPFHFNHAIKGAHEVMWWVAPNAQGAGIGRALLEEIEPACRAKGCAYIQMIHLANSPPQAAALYQRLGYEPTESSFTKRIG
jgi:GNAT superfamily N-acetyltransferase